MAHLHFRLACLMAVAGPCVVLTSAHTLFLVFSNQGSFESQNRRMKGYERMNRPEAKPASRTPGKALTHRPLPLPQCSPSLPPINPPLLDTIFQPTTPSEAPGSTRDHSGHQNLTTLSVPAQPTSNQPSPCHHTWAPNYS